MDNLNLFQSFAPKDKSTKAKGQNAVIYTRVSDSSQEHNTSLESQKLRCEEYAAYKGLNVIGHFGGTYESAKTDDRKQFNEMLKFVKESRNVAYIIVYSYERFSRSGVSGAKIVQDLLMEYGVKTLASSQDLDPTTAAGQLQQNMLFMFGKMDNDMRRDKTTSGMRELLRKGYFPYNPPIGYTNLVKGRAVDHKIVVNEEGKLLRKAFQWKANENMANAEIVRRLRTLGLKTNEKTLGYVLANPFYCGIIVSQLVPGEIIEGRHEAMVSKEMFLKVNNIVFENRSHPVSHNEVDENMPLKRFMKCGKCDTPMTGYLVRKKGLYYYKCRVKGCATNKSAKSAHEHFKSLLSVFEVDPDIAELIGEGLHLIFQAAFAEQFDNARLLKAKITETEEHIKTIKKRFAIGLIDNALYAEFLGEYTDEQGKLQKELAKIAMESSNLENSVKFAIEACHRPVHTWENATIDQRMRMQNQFFPEGVIYDSQTGAVRTRRINTGIVIIPEVAKILEGKKNGEPINIDQFSKLVIRLGFEPRTHTLKVYCSTS
jgi:site-specific DNA recombinase